MTLRLHYHKTLLGTARVGRRINLPKRNDANELPLAVAVILVNYCLTSVDGGLRPLLAGLLGLLSLLGFLALGLHESSLSVSSKSAGSLGLGQSSAGKRKITLDGVKNTSSDHTGKNLAEHKDANLAASLGESLSDLTSGSASLGGLHIGHGATTYRRIQKVFSPSIFLAKPRIFGYKSALPSHTKKLQTPSA